ncbi:MAG: DNA recombination protein RmuC [Candidatus Doudnabacteria bacterium]|nr:DNA recombination protein RmuC [Candidatus Doudnabacteria bacterium]
MTPLIYILIAIIVLGFGGLFFLILKLKGSSNKPQESDQGLNLILQQINELSRTVDTKISESQKIMSESVNTQFSESAKLIKNVTEGLTKLDSTNQQVVSFADQLRQLQDILKNPKQRGVLGEYYLETLLKNVLPPGSYEMQKSFSDGNIVDAVVYVKDKIIPIDSKFSLENYNRMAEAQDPAEKERLKKVFENDLKLRITETAKYILPNEGTMDFAFMFIPHEAIYYDLLTNKVGGTSGEDENLIYRAQSKYKVVIVSPTSFLAYLQTVLQGLKAMQIEETAKDIIKNVEQLGKHLKSYEDYNTKLGNAISTTVNQYNLAGKEYKKIDKDILRITGDALQIETITLEKPEKDED